jgi:transposase InsO family protein
MERRDEKTHHERWAAFRHAVIGQLLSSRLERGELQRELAGLAKEVWRHPLTDAPLSLGRSTLERWYYLALRAANPIETLRRKIRSDAGKQRSVSGDARKAIASQYEEYRSWSYQLHFDNLMARRRLEGGFELPSYTTVVRYMQASGLLRRRRLTTRQTEGAACAARRFEQREVRSYEAAYVNAFWHLDYHGGSLPVLVREGRWVHPELCAMLDDRSRLCCHGQWYLKEEAENTAHAFMQGVLKRGLPRGLMTDLGGAETAEEIRNGLEGLSVAHEPTLPYSPYQNGKQESFWGQVEGRLLAMLEKVENLTLSDLAYATAAWLEQEYNQAVHSETGERPIDRFCAGPDVGRPSPGLEALRGSFCVRRRRKQRNSDGTITLDGKRFEIPSRYERLAAVHVRYARWDLSRVELLDPLSRRPLCRLYPQDKAANADGRRRVRASAPEAVSDEKPKAERFPPLLRELVGQYARTGLPPAYLPKDEAGADPEEGGQA